MQIVITAVGPDNRGLADPIIHYVTGQGANITEIQMYDHDEQSLFAMLLRIELPTDQFDQLATALERDRPGQGLVGPRLVARSTCRPAPAGHLHDDPSRNRRWPCCGRSATGTSGPKQW